MKVRLEIPDDYDYTLTQGYGMTTMVILKQGAPQTTLHYSHDDPESKENFLYELIKFIAEVA
jgi:hypothetical protein